MDGRERRAFRPTATGYARHDDDGACLRKVTQSGETKMPLMSGGDAVVRSMLGHGVTSIYCLPGVQSDHLFNAMFDAGDALQRRAYAARAGRRLHGAGRRARDRQAGRLFGGAGAGLPQLDRGARHRLFDRRARARADRPDPEPRHRQGPRPAARDPRPARHPAHADQVGRAGRAAAGRARRWSAQAFQQLHSGRPRPVGIELPPDVLAAKAEVELVGAARARARACRSTRTRSRAPPVCWRRPNAR